jgi:outer membrane protein assembly factor BamD (BamD/ComL family)
MTRDRRAIISTRSEKSKKSPAESYIDKAIEHLDKRDWNKSIKQFELALSLERENTEALSGKCSSIENTFFLTNWFIG